MLNVGTQRETIFFFFSILLFLLVITYKLARGQFSLATSVYLTSNVYDTS